MAGIMFINRVTGNTWLLAVRERTQYKDGHNGNYNQQLDQGKAGSNRCFLNRRADRQALSRPAWRSLL
jgi:hypothetical protein